MTITRRVAFLVLIAALFGVGSQIRAEEGEVKRERHRYIDGGTVKSPALGPGWTSDERAYLRTFIWDHWQRKQRAKISLIAFSIEGNRTESRYYVEPDANGKWQIVSERCYEVTKLHPQDTTIRRSHFATANITRVIPGPGNVADWKIINEAARRPGNEYMLLFRNDGGDVITKL